MKDFRIIFNGTDPVALPDGTCLGVVGEHNAVQLVITLPDSMIVNMDYHTITIGGIESARIVSTSENVDGAFRVDNVIYQPLTATYTTQRIVDVSVTAYRQVGDSVIAVDKTPTVYGLRFDAGQKIQMIGGLAAEVAALEVRTDALEDDVAELAGKVIETVTVLPDDPDDDEIVYLNAEDSGLYRWDGSDWVRLTDDGEGLEALANVVSDMRDDIPSAEKQASWDSAVAEKHTHSNKAVLDTIVDGKVSAWDDAASKKHTHANKSLLDEITTEDAYGWSDAANKRHIHANKEIIDGFDRQNDGALTFFGEQIPFVQNPDATTLGFKTYTELYVRDDVVTDATTILDVPLYVGGRISDGIICELYESKDADPNFKNGIRLSEFRDDNGVPMLSVLVRVDNVDYTYNPRDFDTQGRTIQAGWHPSEPTITSFTPDRFWFDGVSYSNLNNLSEEAKSVLYSLSQCINESEESFGTIIVSEDSVTRFEGVIKPNRKYMFVTGDDCTFDGLEDVEFSETDAQFVIYLTCTADVDFSFSSTVYFANGTAPNTDTGSHKIIGTWLKEEEVWAIGGIDYSEVS